MVAAIGASNILPAQFELTPLGSMKLHAPGTLLGNSRNASSEWNEYLLTRPSLLKGGHRYAVSFDCKTIDRPTTDSYFYAFFRTGKPDQAGCGFASYFTWKGEPGQTRRIHKKAILPPCDDYQLVLAIHRQGAIEISNMKIEELPPMPLDDPGVERMDEKEPYEPYGIDCHFDWRWFYKSDEEIRRAMTLIKEAGIQWVRVSAGWGFIEYDGPKQYVSEQLDRLDFILREAEAQGLKVYFGVLGTPKWASAKPTDERYWAYAPQRY